MGKENRRDLGDSKKQVITRRKTVEQGSRVVEEVRLRHKVFECPKKGSSLALHLPSLVISFIHSLYLTFSHDYPNTRLPLTPQSAHSPIPDRSNSRKGRLPIGARQGGVG